MDAAVRSLTSLDIPRADKPDTPHLTSAAGAADVELALISDRKAFDALEDEWNALFERAGKSIHVFQTFNFCWHWASHYLADTSANAGTKLSIVTGRRNGRLIMIWPLVSERTHGVTQTFWLGEPVAQYGDALVDPEPDAEAILRAGLAFARRHVASDVLRLRRVRADANVAGLFADAGASIADRQIAPYMDLSSAKGFAAFEERFSSRARRNRRRLARRLEEKGPIEFVRLHGGVNAGDLAADAIAVKAEWLKDRGLVSNALSDQRTTSLFADLAAGREKPVPCVVSALKSNGEIAAYEVSFTCKGRLVIHVMAFKLDFEKAGVGVLLLEQNLKQGFVENLATYDMMAPGDPYKLDWCDKSEAVVDWVMPTSLRGFLYARVYLGFLRPRLKSALKAIPQPLRRILRNVAAA
jgi:CelD/BcsL family acetyltransferase involved in cellulose biosynthesis